MIYRHKDYPHISSEVAEDSITLKCAECGAVDTTKRGDTTARQWVKDSQILVHTWNAEHSTCKQAVH